MSRKPRSFGHPIRFTDAIALPLCLLVSACGGDGTSSVASIPPPPVTPTPTPTPTPAQPAGTTAYYYPATNPVDIQTSWLDSPATRSGTSNVIGRLSLTSGNGDPSSTRAVAPGEFTITTAQPRAQQNSWGNLEYQYTLSAPSGVLPAGLTSIAATAGLSSWDINDTVAFHYPNNPYGDTLQYFGQRLAGFAKAADGSETQLFSYDYTRSDGGGSRVALNPNITLATKLVYDIGFSYVAMGDWSWREVDMNGDPLPGSDSGALLFVNGELTPASGIPISGTATYDARSLELLSSAGTPGIPFTLTADFGQRTISSDIEQAYRYDPSIGSPAFGIHVSGSAPFSNSGAFDIPLTGTVNYTSSASLSTPPDQAVTGNMDGAFFGPHAEQVGGVFSLQSVVGTVRLQDAFAGKQH